MVLVLVLQHDVFVYQFLHGAFLADMHGTDHVDQAAELADGNLLFACLNDIVELRLCKWDSENLLGNVALIQNLEIKDKHFAVIRVGYNPLDPVRILFVL